ncbi:MAG: succinylglutamate desuccinylase/aspartoacylase family protein [Xanthomonadales bacterium]|nr:succinylglutamate desuccinylase/aspartoacylase family protein [Xanthomonadales bacterium]
MADAAGKHIDTIALPALAPGMRWQLEPRRWRGGDGPHVHIQAAVHADEIPPLLLAHVLEQRFDALAAAGRLRGTISLLPFANPLGLAQFVGGNHHGRFELDSGDNFNRGYPDLSAALIERVLPRLGDDPARNLAQVRNVLTALLQYRPPGEPLARLKWELFRLAADADIVLDLHCDYEALPHLYAHARQWPAVADLAHELGMAITLLADDSGGAAFDESCIRPFEAVAAATEHPVPLGCEAVTVELRGERDVDRSLAAQDADGIVRFLQRRGVVEADNAAEDFDVPRATRLEAVDILQAPASGVLVWDRALGEEVRAGDALGHIVVPGQADELPILARTSGLFFVRRGHRWVRRGHHIGKVGGLDALPWRQSGALMYD